MTAQRGEEGNARTRRLVGEYRADACVECGKCLMECPVMRLPEPVAKREIASLRKSGDGAHVPSKCETCFACNLVCPNGANPARLFQDVFYKIHGKEKLPEWSRYFRAVSRATSGDSWEAA